jgi:hypothetical protein
MVQNEQQKTLGSEMRKNNLLGLKHGSLDNLIKFFTYQEDCVQTKSALKEGVQLPALNFGL